MVHRMGGRLAGRGAGALVLASLLLSSGCASLPWKKKDNDEGVKGPSDSFVLRGKGMEKDRGIADPVLQADMDAAHRLFLEKEYGKAESAFAKILKQKNLPVNVAEEALYYEGECQYQVRNFRDAAPTFRKHLKNYRNGQHAQETIQRLFQISDYWLEGTRAEMKTKADGNSNWFTLPASWTVSFSKDMPTFDVEGHALRNLEEIRLQDMGGRYGEQACFYLATVKFFREKYRDADFFFSELYQHYPNSELAPKAIKQSIVCKQICTGGTCYDCRSVEETRKLLDIAPAAYPVAVGKDQEWLERQLKSVNLQQADRDYNIAEFYRRTGHPGSAYFYYELVRRCYPNTDYADKAQERMQELRGRVERELGPAPGGPSMPTPGAPVAPMRLPGGPTAGPGGEPRFLPPSVTPGR